MLPNLDIREALCKTAISEGAGLTVGPSMARVASGSGLRSTFDGDEAPAGFQDAKGLTQSGIEISPMVDRGNRPEYGGGAVGERQGFGCPLDERRVLQAPAEEACDSQHDRSWIDTGDRRCRSGGSTDCGAGPTTHVHDGVVRPEAAELSRQAGIALPAQDHARSGEKPGESFEAGEVGVVVGFTSRLGAHVPDLDS